ncbi:MAG: UDP-N-acetylmuramoyl-tripeptide--D-alanyl-D-alanine ligase [Sandaracinus sp.]
MATPLPRNRVEIGGAAELAEIVLGRVVRAGAPASATSRGVCTDSREVEPGDVFVALVGETHDAHAFLADVVARGAALVVVSRDVSVPDHVGVVRVESTLAALGRLGTWQRVHAPQLSTVIGITGSVGKTTTKEMCAAVLEDLAPGHVVATRGNLNNLVGVPRTLLTVEAGTTYAVVEIGMNVPGEITQLCEIARLDVGIVTSVAAVHTEGVGSIEGVAREKGSLLTSLTEKGTAIFDADEPLLAPYVAASKAARKLGFGKDAGASVQLVSRTATPHGQTVVYRVASAPHDLVVDLAILGEGAAKNAAAAIALAWALAGERGLQSAQRGLESLKPEPGRLCPIRGPGGTVVLDDTYNASPRAVINAIDTATELARATNGRIVAVLGDMLELGALETEMHALVGEHVALAGVSLFVACGKRMRAAADEAREMGADLVIAVDDPMQAIDEVDRFLIEGDVVIVKGSRGMRMERVVEGILARRSSAGGEAAPR